MIEKLYNCDAEVIREIGYLLQKGIEFDDVIVAYESWTIYKWFLIRGL